jgi:hypothetical protein
MSYTVTNSIGTFNIVAIAYGSVLQNGSVTTGLTNAYNCTLLSNSGSNTTIKITNGPNYKFFIPIVTSTQGANNVVGYMSLTSLIVKGYATDGNPNGQNTNFNFVVFGN